MNAILARVEKVSRFAVPLQERLFDKVGDLIRPSWGEDLYSIGQGDLLFGDHCNHLDLARERVGTRVETTVDLDLGKRPVFVPFNEDEIVVSEQTFDQFLDRLVRVGIPEQGVSVIRDEKGLFRSSIVQSCAVIIWRIHLFEVWSVFHRPHAEPSFSYPSKALPFKAFLC